MAAEIPISNNVSKFIRIIDERAMVVVTHLEGTRIVVVAVRVPRTAIDIVADRSRIKRRASAQARREILARCAAIGCVKRDFIAKKGDVFLWAADLLHGSNPRTRSEEETRMSCVTHYCPETTQPL